MNEIQYFQSDQFGSVRVLYEDGKPLFCGVDVCKALGYRNQSKALADHCKGVTKRYILTKGGKQQASFLPEGDLYRLICHSKLPSAENFEHWVFDEVLPSLRQTGQYQTNTAELEQLRNRNATLEQWLHLLAKNKADVVELSKELRDVRAECDAAKARYMAAKANYSKWRDLVRCFENLLTDAHNRVDNCIDQIQIIAFGPCLDSTIGDLCDSLLSQQHHSTTI